MTTIPLLALLNLLVPVAIVTWIYLRWVGKPWEIPYATLRMVAQLLLVGYVLNLVFSSNRWEAGVAIVIFMILVSSLIAIRSHANRTRRNFADIVLAIGIGGTANLALVILAVLQLEPVFQMEVLIPLAGMIYSNAMNTVSFGGERFWKEVDQGADYRSARSESYRAALIPQINSLLAVGLVALPGMMTGQVLSGVSPLIAARYQIMVMCMILGTAGISFAIYLVRVKRQMDQTRESS